MTNRRWSVLVCGGTGNFIATFNGSGPGMMGAGTRMGFSGTVRIKRSEFGVTNAKQFAGDDIDLEFEIEFVKK